MECRYCGSENVRYIGVDDGGGDFGSAVCDEYECRDCGNAFEANCLEARFEDDIDHEKRSAAFMDNLFGDDNAHLDIGDIPF